MSLSQASPDRAGDAARSVPQSWEAPVPATGTSDSGQRQARGILTFAGVTAFLRRNARKIGSLALILFTAGIVILEIIPVRYAATALVLVDPRELHVTADQDVLPGIGQDAAALQSLVEIAKSDGFLRPLIEKLKIAEDDDIAGSEQNPSKLLEKFRARLNISRRGLTYVIAMTFSSRSPQAAAYYANAVAEAFVANQTRFRTGAIEDAASFLNSRLKTLNDQVRAADDAVAAFKAEHRIINAGKESTTRQLRVTELSQQVSAARLLTEEAKNRYAQAQRNLKADVEATTGSRTDLLSILRAQRSQLNDQIAQKRAVLGDRHPDLVISYNQLNELNRQIETERKRNIDSAKSDYETLRDQQASLEQQLASLEGDMLTDVQASTKLQELQRDADANRNIYEQFLSRFKTTNEQRLLQTSQARIVSAATAPTRPTRPPLPLILIALALGAVLSSGAIVTLLDQAKGADLPKPETPPRSETKAARPAPAAKADATPDIPVWGRIPNLAVSLADRLGWRRTTEHGGEADLRSHLQELLGKITATPGQRANVVLVTSGQPGVGKSSVARSLNAAAIERGMLSVLIRVTQDSAAAQPVQLPTEASAPNRGRVLTTTARSLGLLLGDSRARQAPAVPGDVRSEFDLIVIDAPALGPQSDAAAIAAHADFTILVVADGAANAGIVRSAKAALSRFGNTRLGLVINKMGPRMANPADLTGRDRRPEKSAGIA
jgi:polysaccharide biosynthesis transport protein